MRRTQAQIVLLESDARSRDLAGAIIAGGSRRGDYRAMKICIFIRNIDALSLSLR